MSYLCTCMSNCYKALACFFITEGTEFWSTEATTQGNPTVLAAYDLGVTPLIQHLLEITSSNKLHSKEIAYTDDFTIALTITFPKTEWIPVSNHVFCF